MSSTVYHILYNKPAFLKPSRSRRVENLSHLLVKSNQLRIDAGAKRNFVRYTDSKYDFTITLMRSELTDPKQIPSTKRYLASLCARHFHNNRQLETYVEKIFSRAKYDLEKFLPLSFEEELALARLLIQAAHPVVILLILIEKVKIFLTYGYEVGDVLDVATWRQHGSNSGMQSTDMLTSEIFVSAGGDPFAAEDAKDATYGDGWPSIARLMIIAGQEIGHYADLIRARDGRYRGRHSCYISPMSPKPEVNQARENDINYIKRMNHQLYLMGLQDLKKTEEAVKFYHKMKRWRKYVFLYAKMYSMRFIFKHRCMAKGLFFINKIKDKYLASYLEVFIKDMLFNLHPVADVYQSPNINEEIAIVCAEALARVPQQQLKWGRAAVKFCSRNLYNIYYQKVIKACIISYEEYSNQKFRKANKMLNCKKFDPKSLSMM